MQILRQGTEIERYKIKIMKFTERTKLNLSNVNKEVLEEWNKEDMFHKSIDAVRAAHSSSSSKVHHRLMDILASTM